MKIVYINAMGPTEKNKTAAVFVSERIKALLEIGIDVTAYSYFMDYSAPLKKYMSKSYGYKDMGNAIDSQIGVNYAVRNFPYGMVDALAFKKNVNRFSQKVCNQICADIQKNGGDLLHIHWLWPFGLGVMQAAKKLNIPYFVTCHGSDVNLQMPQEAIKPHFIEILENADKVEFISEALLKTAIKNGYSGKNAYVCYNGIDTEIFNEKDIKKNKNTIIFVGNLIKTKGADRLPLVFKEIYSQNKNIKFKVIGDGELRENIENQCAGLPVTFTGRLEVSKVAQEMKQSDVLMLLSRHEGFGCVIKEAQACGVYPVTSNVGGICEALAGVGSAVDFSDENVGIINSAREVLDYLNGNKNIEISQILNAAKNFDWKERQQKTVCLYKEFTGKSDKND